MLRDSLIPGMGYERGRGTARMVGRDLRRTTGGLVFRYVDLATRVEFRRSSPRSSISSTIPSWLIFAVNSGCTLIGYGLYPSCTSTVERFSFGELQRGEKFFLTSSFIG